MTEPSATILLDSISEEGQRLTSMEVVMHRFVLAEFNTHRMFSRNSASSRAIPVRKQIERVKSDPAVPISFPTERKGMVGGDELVKGDRIIAEKLWHDARFAAIRYSGYLADHGVHKSVVNRVLEPFMWHTIIVSSTEWDNFWVQRCSPLAMPEMRAAAEAMKAAYDASEPAEVDWGDWHLPLIDQDEWFEMENLGIDQRHVSAARCARVSYLTHDGVRDYEEDLALYKRLSTAEPPHASPLEHVATPVRRKLAWQTIPCNFFGWRQLRHEVLA